MGRTLRAWLWLGLGAALATPAPAQDRPEAPCSAWPGEPAPLPGLSDEDPLRARWAQLRVAELADHALRFEAHSPVGAHRLWTRVLCFAPDHEEALRGLERTRPVEIRRPDDPARRDAERKRRLLDFGTSVANAESQLRQARFREALRQAGRARAELEQLEESGDGRSQRVRLELLSATAQIALGQRGAALESLARALHADPGLELDPSTTSPRLVHALHEARSTGAAR